MPNTPKRRKTETTSIVSNQKFYCCRCGTAYSRQKGYFPVSHSPMYRGSGYVPMCNDCVEELYDTYRDKLGDDREAMRRICMKLDLYWNDSIYDMVEKSAGVNSRIRNYIGKTNIQRYLDKSFDDTLAEEAKAARISGAANTPKTVSAEDGEAMNDGLTVDASVMSFWGRGYDTDFYIDLEKRYQKWTGNLKNLTPVEESLYKQVCLSEELIARSGAKGEVADKANKTLMDALSALNIKPSQVKDDGKDAELEKMPLGVGIQTWEFSRPLPETPDELKDKSHIVRDITTWFLGHACKMVGLRNSYCKMYEQAMDELRVKRPEFADEDDDTMLADIFGAPNTDCDSE